MLQTHLIKQFLDQKNIAVVGVSRQGDLPANLIFKKFRDNHYRTYAINPNATTVEESPAYSSLDALPEKVTAVMLASTPEVSEIVARDCANLGIKHIWMHRGIGKGSFSAEAEEYLKKNNIEPITNGCPMMFIGKVDLFHRFFRWIKR